MAGLITGRTSCATLIVAWLPLWACGQRDEPPLEIDAAQLEPDASSGPCWPTEGLQPRGTIEPGIGDQYQPMPDEVPLFYGAQGGFGMRVHARMTGLVPGNPSDILDPSNPRTRFRTFFVDTGLPTNEGGLCPFRHAYVPDGNGGYVVQTGLALVFNTCWGSQGLIGNPIRVELEIIDADGGYARTEKIVSPIAPTEDGWPDTPNHEPCPPP
jgi:hypothetical protein